MYKGVNEDQQSIIMNGCEKHVMAKLFKKYIVFVVIVFYMLL